MSESHLRILVVDDETAIRRFLRASLSSHGHTVFEAANGQDAIRDVAANRPDVIILDLGLPDLDGIEVVRQLREWATMPIIILSVREHENDKIAALDAGADDYLTKPFGVGELMARIRVAMRRSTHASDGPIFQTGNLRIDMAKRIVTVTGQEIQLTPTEYDLLRVLVNNAGKVVTHNQLLRQVWGGPYEEEAHLLRVHISNLRAKLEDEPARPQYILTEAGVGYRLHIAEM